VRDATYVIHFVLGPTLPPIQWVPRALSLGVKRPGSATDHSSPSSAEVKKSWSYTSTPQYAFMAWCSVKAQGQPHPPSVIYFMACSDSELTSETMDPFRHFRRFPWTGNQPDARPLGQHNTEKPRARFEPTIPVFE